MKSKSYVMVLATGALALGVCGWVVLAESSTQPPKSESVNMERNVRIQRGEYLVHRVGLCIDCHSPRDERGGFIASKHLMGAPIPFTPKFEMPWMPVAPRLAGIPAGYTEQDLVHFLSTGERPNGNPPPLPPMPPYRLNRDDAEAVAAYLKTLPRE